MTLLFHVGSKWRGASEFNRSTMRVSFIISVLLLSGCAASHPSSEWSSTAQNTILDQVVAKREYRSDIKQAEQDLPGDQWREQPWRSNVSRFHRESGVAQQMLDEIRPKLKQMTVTELARSLKVTPRMHFPNVAGVAYYVFRDGNRMIISEIQSRPKSELSVLPGLADENMELWEGDQGPGDSLAEVIHYRILNDR
jgi:hypothetical protein